MFYTLFCSAVSSICPSTQLVNTIFFTIFPRGLQLRFGCWWNWLHINVLKHHKCENSHQHLWALTENLTSMHTEMHFVKNSNISHHQDMPFVDFTSRQRTMLLQNCLSHTNTHTKIHTEQQRVMQDQCIREMMQWKKSEPQPISLIKRVCVYVCV